MKQVLPGANIAHSAVLIDVPKNTSPADMLRPKPERGDCTPFVPVMSPDALQALIREVAPDEVKALAWIAEFADMLPLPDDVGESFPYVNWWRDYGACALLVVPVTPQVLDTLAAFEAEAEDRESDHDDEIEEDEDRDQDSALDSGGPGHPYGNAYVDDYEPDYRVPNSHLKQLPWGTGKPSENELVPVMKVRRDGPS